MSNSVRILSLVAAAAVSLVACGAPVADQQLPPFPIATGSQERAPASTVVPTTLRLVVEELPVVTLAPAGKFPVLTAREAASSERREPGTYRVRQEHQAEWPEECLGEMIVFPSPQEGAPLETVPYGKEDSRDEFPVNWEQIAQYEIDEKRRLQHELCGPLIDKWNDTWPEQPSAGTPIPDGEAPPTTKP